MALFQFRKIQHGGCRHLGKISNRHISATGRPIHSMFGSRAGFSETADLIALFPVRKKSKMAAAAIFSKMAAAVILSKMAAAAILEKFEMAISPQPFVRSTSCFVLRWVFRGQRI